MNEHTDTLIIGAGPSGISAAIMLQRLRVPHVIIDKSCFPREKVCGGLVTYKTRRVLYELLGKSGQRNIREAFCDRSAQIEIYDRTKRLACADISKELMFVKRECFDNILVSYYKKLGGKIYENEKNYQADFSKRKIILQNGTVITYDKLIVADGALSLTREKLGSPKQKLSFCIEAYAPKALFKNPGRTRIYFGIIDRGYAWAFPSGNEMCIGLGGDYDKNISYVQRLKDFLAQLNVSFDKCRIRGAFVPGGELSAQGSSYENVLFVGDAGGYVDPIYGEGLFFALSSGMAAAKACALPGGNIKKTFLRSMNAHINMIENGNRLKGLFFTRIFQRFFKFRVYEKSRFLRYYCDNQVSTYRYSYDALFRLYIDYKKEALCFKAVK